MKEKTKNVVISIGFVLILFLVFLINIVKKDEEISWTERRKLAQFSSITKESILKGQLSDKFEKYATDQFISRDNLRSVKSLWSNYIFWQKDNNGLFLKDNSIYKIEYPLNKKAVQNSANKINNIYQKYLQGMSVYFAVIPDKNYYLKDEYLKINPLEIEKIIKDTNPQIKSINITDSLSLKDYYRTDLHWKQENLGKVVNTIEKAMNLNSTGSIAYQEKSYGDFYGTYYGQLGLKVMPDKIVTLTNEIIENAVTYDYETGKNGKIYDEEKLKQSSDKYDIYLSGAKALIEIENKNSKTQKELLLFRDSFGSSLAPLLLENYKKITLIDLRYISSSIIDKYVSFNNQDVLFLYSTLVLNY